MMRAKRHQRALTAAYREVFASEQGKLVLDDLMKFTGVMRQSHVPGDPLDTAFLEGKRRVGLRILAQMEVAPREAMGRELRANVRELDDDED